MSTLYTGKKINNLSLSIDLIKDELDKEIELREILRSEGKQKTVDYSNSLVISRSLLKAIKRLEDIKKVRYNRK